MPQAFLSTYLLSIAGSSPSGIRAYNITTYAGVGGTEGFQLVNAPLGHLVGNVHVVRMIPNTEDVDIAGMEPYVLDGTGPDIMVTGQLSGCVFAIAQGVGQLVVWHIQPGGTRLGGAALRQAVRLTGRFTGHGRVTHVFGIGDYTQRAHIVGIRNGGTWHIYAQLVASGAGPVTAARQVI